MSIARFPRLTHLTSRVQLAAYCLIMLMCASFAACGKAQEAALADARKLLEEADIAFTQKDFAAAADKATAAAKLAKNTPSFLQRAAEILYLSGRSADSLPLFDRVIELVPEAAASNWQRGIALCSCGKFAEGAEQFKIHHDVNPDDVENSAWYFLCIAKTKGIEAARETVIPSNGDGREPMMSILKMLQGKIEPAEVLEAAKKNTESGQARVRAQFYAALYAGLYYDSLGDEKLAVKHLKESLSYGDFGYMVDTARVYLADRFKSTALPDEKSEK